jgi:hypothetical protein
MKKLRWPMGIRCYLIWRVLISDRKPFFIFVLFSNQFIIREKSLGGKPSVVSFLRKVGQAEAKKGVK